MILASVRNSLVATELSAIARNYIEFRRATANPGEEESPNPRVHLGAGRLSSHVGSRTLNFCDREKFDIVLASSYLPDLYVGDFFDRFNRLSVHPCAIVMQEG